MVGGWVRVMGGLAVRVQMKGYREGCERGVWSINGVEDERVILI